MMNINNELLSFDNIKECLFLILKKNLAVRCKDKQSIKLLLDTALYCNNSNYKNQNYYNFNDDTIFYFSNLEYRPRIADKELLSKLDYIILDFNDFIKLNEINKNNFYYFINNTDYSNIINMIKEYDLKVNLKVKKDNLQSLKQLDYGIGV